MGGQLFCLACCASSCAPQTPLQQSLYLAVLWQVAQWHVGDTDHVSPQHRLVAHRELQFSSAVVMGV